MVCVGRTTLKGFGLVDETVGICDAALITGIGGAAIERGGGGVKEGGGVFSKACN